MNAVNTKSTLQTIVFVGNPNSGKTTLFNKLTGANQKTGNFCGVTVDWVSAECTLDSEKIQLIDLPGLYTLATGEDTPHADTNEDERIARHFLSQNRIDLLVNVVDASNLERNLYLTLQSLELNIPTIVVLTRLDLAQKKHLNFNLLHLQKALGCPVVAVSAKTEAGIQELKTLLFSKIDTPKNTFRFPKMIENEIAHLRNKSQSAISRAQAIRHLESGYTIAQDNIKKLTKTTNATKLKNQKLNNDPNTDLAANDYENNYELDIAMAMARYAFIEKTLAHVILPSDLALKQIKSKSSNVTQWIDKFACHKWLGLPSFLIVMYLLFFFAMNIGGAFQDCVEQLSQLVFVQIFGDLMQWSLLPHWLVAIGQGMGRGLTTVLSFVPVIGAMFFALAFLESCGYMSRAAIVMDRVMLFLGLPGKSFVPMIIGFGCNVPAILGTRTLDSKRDRILTVMMSPFMSCGARLAIFTVFVSTFFPLNGQNIVFSLYLIGIFMAILTGLLLKKTLLTGPASPLIMEMPEYTLPTMRTLIRLSYFRLKRFVLNALKLIVPVCMVVGLLNDIHMPSDNHVSSFEEQSVLSALSKKVTPIFAPMGITQDNWPATVGLFTGVLAKEVVIGSLNTLYAQNNTSEGEEYDASYWSQVQSALKTVPQNLLTLRGAVVNPIAAKAPEEVLEKQAHQEMLQKFGGAKAAFAYLLFILIYFPCISATAAMVREVKKGWTIFSVCWTTGLAYCTAVTFYQLSTWLMHPLQSSLWCLIVLTLLFFTSYAMFLFGKQQLRRSLPTQIVFADLK